MNTSRYFLVLFFSHLLVTVGFAEKPIQPKTIEANARAGKKVSLTFLLPEKIDRDEFMKSNRLMAGMWLAERPVQRKGGKPGDFHLPSPAIASMQRPVPRFPAMTMQQIPIRIIESTCTLAGEAA